MEDTYGCYKVDGVNLAKFNVSFVTHGSYLGSCRSILSFLCNGLANRFIFVLFPLTAY